MSVKELSIIYHKFNCKRDLNVAAFLTVIHMTIIIFYSENDFIEFFSCILFYLIYFFYRKIRLKNYKKKLRLIINNQFNY